MRISQILHTPRLAFLLLASLAATAPVTPNILVIISDDQGYADFSRSGTEQVDTPNLEKLARRANRRPPHMPRFIRWENFAEAAVQLEHAREAEGDQI